MSVIEAGLRWLVVVAHPDDEVLGCGALLSRLAAVEVVHVTDGAPRDGGDARRHGFDTPADYAAARWREARAALDLAGVPEGRHHGFGVADQGAAHRLGEITRRLAPHVERADAVLTHAYEGGHPDHDAVAFAVHAAARRAAGMGRPIVEMPFYHAAPDGWVRQAFLPVRGQALLPLGEKVPVRGNEGDTAACAPLPPSTDPSGHLLPSRGEGNAEPFAIEVLVLTPAELALKRRMAACHATQGDTLSSFDLGREAFRRAPAYDFARLPHDGDLLYERHGWNLDRAGWLAAVRAAEAGFRCGRAGTAP